VCRVRLVALPTTHVLWVGVIGSSRSTRGGLEGPCAMGRRRRLDGRECEKAASASLLGCTESRSHALMSYVVARVGVHRVGEKMGGGESAKLPVRYPVARVAGTGMVRYALSRTTRPHRTSGVAAEMHSHAQLRAQHLCCSSA
jgi:hypothetical protein